MKAVRLLEYGGQLVFNDVPTPTIARDEILVKVKSTAVNHLDLVEASGTARQILPIDLPCEEGTGPRNALRRGRGAADREQERYEQQVVLVAVAQCSAPGTAGNDRGG